MWYLNGFLGLPGGVPPLRVGREAYDVHPRPEQGPEPPATCLPRAEAQRGRCGSLRRLSGSAKSRIVALDLVTGWLLALLMLLILVGGDWNLTLYDFYFPIDWE